MEICCTRATVHGTDAAVYADRLRERLPTHDVRLAETPAEERELARTADVLTGEGRRLSAVLDAVDRLRLFACVYAGTDHLPLDRLREAGVAVTNAAGVHAPNVSEYAVAAMLAAASDFARADRNAERGVWRSYPTRELHGSTIGIVGLGSIGTAVAERLAVRHTPSKNGPVERVVGYDEASEVFARADWLVLACPLTATTRALLDREAFETLPADAHVVNVARGPVIETDALVDALRENRIGGATLDVTDPEPLPPEHPLWSFDDVRVTPHNAGHTPAYFDRLAEVVARNVDRLDDEEPLDNRVA